MCQHWCLRRSHCARDQSQFCVCCPKTLAMYSSRRQRHVSPGMHGWYSDAAAQLHHTKNDCAYDRPQQSFTLKSGHHAPPSMPRNPYSHAIPSHGYTSLCSNEQNHVHHHTNTNTTSHAMMDTVPTHIFDDLPATHSGPVTQSVWPTPLPDYTYGDFVRDLEAAQTVSPADLSIHPTDHYPATPHRPPLVHNAGSQGMPSSSSKSSSHISTPSLTPHTPDEGCSTPETSIDGVADGVGNGAIAFRPEAQRLHRYKPILPASSRPDIPGDGVALDTPPLDWPQISPHQAFGGEIPLRESLLAANYLPANMSTAIQPNEQDQLPSELDWLGLQSMSNNHPEFIDASKLFDFDFDGSGDRSNSSIMSRYPPLTDTRTTALDPNVSRGDWNSSQYGKGLYLPNLSLEMDDDPFVTNASRPYTDLFDTDDTIGLYQSVERRSAGTEYGEGSRRDTSRDDELLQLRRQGISYREIKQKYGFTEAESTLRGRYRTLTKSKDRRVRKPIWKDRDVS